jgi:hypothetical protein
VLVRTGRENFRPGLLAVATERTCWRVPSGPDWLNPRALNYGVMRKPFQGEVVRLHPLASGAASDLRTVATQYPE